MRKIILFLTLLTLILFSPSPLFSQEKKEVDQILFKGIAYIHTNKFNEAFQEFEKLIQLFPDDPLGYFYMAAAYENMMDNYRNYSPPYRSEFEKYANLAIEKGKLRKEKKTATAEDYLYLGGAYGYRGIYKSFIGQWWGAFKDGWKAKPLLEKSLELDSTLYDAYLGLGEYWFWRTVKAKALIWLPFVGDNRKKGINMLKLITEKGKYTKVEGDLALLRIYVENKDYPQALILSQKIKEEVGDSSAYRLWFTGLAQEKLRDYRSAIATYLSLLAILKSSAYYHPAGEIECRYYLANCYYKERDFTSCRSQLNALMEFAPKWGKEDNLEDFFKQAKKLLKEVQPKEKD
jgi:hypothetical protein